MLGTDGNVTSRLPIGQVLTVVCQNCKKSAVKYSIEKATFLNFVDFLQYFVQSFRWVSFTVSVSSHNIMAD